MQKSLFTYMNTNERFGVLDIETRHSAADVGGWHNADKMGVAVAVLYDSSDDTLHAYKQDECQKLLSHMQELSLVVGFNHIGFDYSVLNGVVPYDYKSLPSLDLLVNIHKAVGYRIKLENIAMETLNVGKSADGLQSLQWWKEGKEDLILEYCKQDVLVTRDIFLFAREYQQIFYQNKQGKRECLKISW